MKLYFSPLACSLATRIALYEAGADVEFVQVDGKTKKTEDGRDYRQIHPLALVPALELQGGVVLTENAAVLQYVAGRFPEARLAPTDPEGRARLQQWLCFIGTELHKAVYVPQLDRNAAEVVKAYALAKAESRLAFLAKHLEGRSHLLDEFTVADGYLFAVLNWSMVTPVDLGRWPAIQRYHAAVGERPAVARAFAEERALYLREVEKSGQAAQASANPKGSELRQ
jgi:glutathione S-transferase